MKVVIAVFAFAALATSGSAQLRGSVSQPLDPTVVRADAARVDRLAGWLRAVEEHEPGARDDAALRIASWSRGDLASIELDAWVLASLTENLQTSRFIVKDEGSGERTRIEYPTPLLERMRALACVAAGALATDACLAVDAGRGLDPLLQRLAAHAARARGAGDRNYFLRRSALLHTDIVTMQVYSAARVTPADTGREQFFDLNDGRVTGVSASPEHWDIARSMLDRVVPAGAGRAKPSADPMVREWYIATISWLEGTLHHSAQQMRRALKLFPNDADIQFLAGWQHESFSEPSIQEALKGVVASAGYMIPVRSERDELQAAEASFRRALDLQPSMTPARVRLGYVLLRLGRFAEAVETLRAALPGLEDPALRYDAQMFLGASEEGLSHDDRAERAYREAVALFPTAQSGHVALSELAWKSGRRDAALEALSRAFTISPPARDDPWLSYDTSAVADPVERLNALRHRLADSWRDER